MSFSQKVCLKWQDFSVNLPSVFSELRTEGEFSDVTLAWVEGWMEGWKGGGPQAGPVLGQSGVQEDPAASQPPQSPGLHEGGGGGHLGGSLGLHLLWRG